MTRRRVLLAIMCTVIAFPAPAAPPELEEIFAEPPPEGRLPDPLGWLEDGAAWVKVEEEALVAVDVASGRETTIAVSTALGAACGGDGEAEVRLKEAAFHPRRPLVAVPVGDRLVVVGGPDGPACLGPFEDPAEHVAFSPAGERLAWVADHDLMVHHIPSGATLRLTEDGSDTVFNGVLDWVYWEELAGRSGRAFVFADDGAGLLWLRLDDGPVPPYHLVDRGGVHTELRLQRVPRPGDPLPLASLHLVRLRDGVEEAGRFELETPPGAADLPLFGFTPAGEVWL